MKSILTIILTLAVLVSAEAQMCLDYHREKKFCPPSKDGFIYNGQSRSAYFYKGQESQLNMIFHNKQDYRVTFCLEGSLGDRLEFKIKDGKTGELLYDNADEDYATTFEFRCEATRRLSFDVKVPEEGDGGSGSGKLSKLKSTASGCLGVLVEHVSTQRAGF